MNAVWIALIAVFAALIPVFVFASKKTQDLKAEARKAQSGGSADDGFTGLLIATDKPTDHSHTDASSDAAGDAGGGDGGGGGGSD